MIQKELLEWFDKKESDLRGQLEELRAIRNQLGTPKLNVSRQGTLLNAELLTDDLEYVGNLKADISEVLRKRSKPQGITSKGIVTYMRDNAVYAKVGYASLVKKVRAVLREERKAGKIRWAREKRAGRYRYVYVYTGM